MKSIVFATLISLVAGSAAFAAVEPIPGSIIYDNPGARLEKAPAGSIFSHTFTTENGQRANETYKVNQDKSFSLVDRTFSDES